MCKTGLKAESMGMHKQNPSCFVILKQKHGRERNNDNSTYLYNGSHYRLLGSIEQNRRIGILFSLAGKMQQGSNPVPPQWANRSASSKLSCVTIAGCFTKCGSQLCMPLPPIHSRISSARRAAPINVAEASSPPGLRKQVSP